MNKRSIEYRRSLYETSAARVATTVATLVEMGDPLDGNSTLMRALEMFVVDRDDYFAKSESEA